MAPVYATLGQLAEWLGLAEPPAGAERALRDASVDIDYLLRTAVYRVDAAGAPVEARVADTLRDAVLYQVEHGSPELSGRKAMPPGMRAVRIGQISYTAATNPVTGAVVKDAFAPRAVRLLVVEALIPNHPWMR